MNGVPDDREGFAAFLLRLRGKGVASKELVAALEATPRRDFLPGQWQSAAWSDRMVPIECGEAIEGADVQAIVIAALDIQPGHRVLEVGTGSGYTAAVMTRLGGRVVTLDRYKTLVEQARLRFEKLGLVTAFARQADGGNGLPGEGPFDRIVAWTAFDSLPRPFVDQLSSGGIMIAPIGPAEGEQVFSKLTKVGSRFEREDIATVRLQPIAKGVAAVL
jgi:protein-L-isoaspartate(D-aspartate) O-methyltransferase